MYKMKTSSIRNLTFSLFGPRSPLRIINNRGGPAPLGESLVVASASSTAAGNWWQKDTTIPSNPSSGDIRSIFSNVYSSGKNGWGIHTTPSPGIYSVFADAFGGSANQIGEPITEWVMRALPEHRQTDKAVYQTLLGLTTYECLKFGGGVFLGKATGSSDNDDDGVAVQSFQAGTLIRECTPKDFQPKGWFSKRIHDLQMLWAYLVVTRRHHYGALDVMEDRKYAAYRNRLFERGEHYLEKANKVHLEHGPQEPHWHVMQVAVHPSGQGKGLGKNMLGMINDLADEHSKACYLETKGERNIHVYESMGYRVVGEYNLIQSEISDDECTGVVGMVREPRQES